MKKVAIYARVSTALQEQEKTIESQLSELREICRDFEVVQEYCDSGWSGELLARPALDQLRDDISTNLFEAVYIHSPDRLSRKYAYQILILEELRKKDIEVVFLNKPVSDSPEDQLLLGVQGLIAEYEKAKILERTRRGRLHKAREKHIVGGKPPFGYIYVKKTPEKKDYYKVHTKEAKIVNLLFDLYMQHKSINKVVTELLGAGVPTQLGKNKWCRSTIRGILVNESYVGRGYYGKRFYVESDNGQKYKRRVKTSVRWRDKAEWIPIEFPVIVSENKFQTVRELLSKGYRPYAKTKHFYLTSGLIRCKYCGSTFTGETKNLNTPSEASYYRCNNRHKSNPEVICNVPTVRSKEFDKKIWDTISRAATHPRVLRKHVSYLADNISGGGASLEIKKKQLLKDIRGVEEQKGRLLDVYTTGGIDKKLFLEKMSSYDLEITKDEEALGEIDKKLSQKIDRPLIMNRVTVFCNLAKAKLAMLDSEQKRDFIRYITSSIELDSRQRKAKITGHIPINPKKMEGFSTNDGGTMYTSLNLCASRLNQE